MCQGGTGGSDGAGPELQQVGTDNMQDNVSMVLTT